MRGRSVDRGVFGIVREHRDPAPLAAQHVAPEVLRDRRRTDRRGGSSRRTTRPASSSASSWPGPNPRSRRRCAARRSGNVEVDGIAADVDGADLAEHRDPTRRRVVAAARERDHRFGRDRPAAEHHARAPTRAPATRAAPSRATPRSAGSGRCRARPPRRARAAARRVRSKFGSTSGGVATSSRPRSDPESVATILILAPPYARVGDSGPRTSLLARAARARSATRTCSPIPTSSPARSRDWTGRFVGATPAVVRPGTVDEVAGGAARVRRRGRGGRPAGRQHRARRRFGAAARRDRARPAPPRRARTRSTRAPGRSPRRPASRSPGCTSTRTPRAGTTASTSSRAAPRPSAARSRPTRAACTCCATARPAARCSASRPCSPTGASCAGSTGSRRTTRATTSSGLAVRERGNARGDHRRAPAARAPRRRTWSSRCSRSTTSTPRSTRSATLRRALDCAARGRAVLRSDGLDLVCEQLGWRAAVRGPARRRSCSWRRRARRRSHRRARGARSTRSRRVADVAVAADDRSRAATLWRYREGHTEAINLLGAPHKLDVTLPADELAGFVRRGARARRARSRPTRRSGCSDTRPTATCTST